MTVTVCDFAVLTDGRFDLNTQEVHRETFNRPPGFVRGTNLAQPVLMFKVKPDGATRFNIRVGLNQPGQNLPDAAIQQEFEIGTGDNDDEQLRSLHLVIPGSEFDQPVTAIDFHVSRGRAAFAEVVLMHQVRIDSDPT